MARPESRPAAGTAHPSTRPLLDLLPSAVGDNVDNKLKDTEDPDRADSNRLRRKLQVPPRFRCRARLWEWDKNMGSKYKETARDSGRGKRHSQAAWNNCAVTTQCSRRGDRSGSGFASRPSPGSCSLSAAVACAAGSRDGGSRRAGRHHTTAGSGRHRGRFSCCCRQERGPERE